jgi:hypothetical protein
MRRLILCVGSSVSISRSKRASVFFLGPLAVPLGLASVFSATSALVFFDRPWVRVLLTGLSILGMSANIYACWHVYALRRKARLNGVRVSRFPSRVSRSQVLSSPQAPAPALDGRLSFG